MAAVDSDSFTNTPLFSSTFILPNMPSNVAPNDKGDEAQSQIDHVVDEFGGPEDFTEHLTEYMMGHRDFKPASSQKQTQSPDAEETFLRISKLQAEVEKMRKDEETRLHRQQELEKENEELRKENEEACQRFEELEKLSQPDGDVSQEPAAVPDQVSRDLEMANEEIHNLKFELQAAQNKVDHLESEYESFKENGSDVVAYLKEELQRQKDATEMERNKSFVIAREAAKLSETKEESVAALQAMRDDADAMSDKYDHLYEDLQEARRILEEVEDENEKLAQENETQRTSLSAKEEQLESKNTELRAAHNNIVELRTQVEEAQTEPHSKDDMDAEKATLITQHEQNLNKLKFKYAKDIKTLRSALHKSTQSHKASATELKRTHASELSALCTRITELERLEEAPSTHSIEDELRTAVRVLNTKLSTANNAIRQARQKAENANDHATEVEDRNRLVNAELERRFVEATEKRELEWQRRVHLLFMERDRMGKALLREWGREEVGTAGRGERQGYRYKYVKGRF